MKCLNKKIIYWLGIEAQNQGVLCVIFLAFKFPVKNCM